MPSYPAGFERLYPQIGRCGGDGGKERALRLRTAEREFANLEYLRLGRPDSVVFPGILQFRVGISFRALVPQFENLFF